MVQAAVSARFVFDLQPRDIFWCTADCGWITGVSPLRFLQFLPRTCIKSPNQQQAIDQISMNQIVSILSLPMKVCRMSFGSCVHNCNNLPLAPCEPKWLEIVCAASTSCMVPCKVGGLYAINALVAGKKGLGEVDSAEVFLILQHTYVYGPLLNGATLVLWEGVPTFPKPNRIWQIVEKHKVAYY